MRDSKIVHTLLGIKDYNELAGHPIVGASWESHVIENLLAATPANTIVSFYRTAAGTEIDLLLEMLCIIKVEALKKMRMKLQNDST